MKVVGFVGSPRKEGNTNRLIEGVLAGAEDAGHETEKIYLTDYELTPIDAVYGPELEWTDPRQEVADALIDRIVDSDAVVLGSPVYWVAPSGLMKLFIDRWALYQRDGERFLDLVGGKQMAAVFAMADPHSDYVDAVVEPLRVVANWLGMEWAGEVVARGVAEPGDVDEKTQVLKKARELGRSL